jgi:hypothetical protein
VSSSKDRDYSHRSLVQKLGVRSEHRVYVRSVDAEFRRDLTTELESPIAQSLRGEFDLIFLHVDTLRDLDAIIKLASHLRSNGALWIFHPKGRGAAPTDADVRAAGLSAGLVDNKICAYTQTHTATRYVIPVAKRTSLA